MDTTLLARHTLLCILIRASGGLDDTDGKLMAEAFTRAVAQAWGPEALVSHVERVSPIAMEVKAFSKQDWDAETQRHILEETLISFSQQPKAFGEAKHGAARLMWIFSQKKDDGKIFQGTTLQVHSGPPQKEDVSLQPSFLPHIYSEKEDVNRLRECVHRVGQALNFYTDPDFSVEPEHSIKAIRQRL